MSSPNAADTRVVWRLREANKHDIRYTDNQITYGFSFDAFTVAFHQGPLVKIFALPLLCNLGNLFGRIFSFIQGWEEQLVTLAYRPSCAVCPDEFLTFHHHSYTVGRCFRTLCYCASMFSHSTGFPLYVCRSRIRGEMMIIRWQSVDAQCLGSGNRLSFECAM